MQLHSTYTKVRAYVGLQQTTGYILNPVIARDTKLAQKLEYGLLFTRHKFGGNRPTQCPSVAGWLKQVQNSCDKTKDPLRIFAISFPERKYIFTTTALKYSTEPFRPYLVATGRLSTRRKK